MVERRAARRSLTPRSAPRAWLSLGHAGRGVADLLRVRPLVAGDGAAGRPHKPRPRPELHDHGRHSGRLAAGLHRGRRALRRLRRPRGAQVVAVPGRPHHHRIGRTARRRLRRRLDVHSRRALRHRRAARLHRRAQGHRPMVRGCRARLRPGRLPHGPLPRAHPRSGADQQRPDAADGRQLARGPADLYRLHPRRRPGVAAAGQSSGQPDRGARRAPARDRRRPARRLRAAAAAAEHSGHPGDQHRCLLLPSRHQQLAAGDLAHGRHGAGCRRYLVCPADRRRHRRRPDDPGGSQSWSGSRSAPPRARSSCSSPERRRWWSR